MPPRDRHRSPKRRTITVFDGYRCAIAGAPDRAVRSTYSYDRRHRSDRACETRAAAGGRPTPAPWQDRRHLTGLRLAPGARSDRSRVDVPGRRTPTGSFGPPPAEPGPARPSWRPGRGDRRAAGPTTSRTAAIRAGARVTRLLRQRRRDTTRNRTRSPGRLDPGGRHAHRKVRSRGRPRGASRRPQRRTTQAWTERRSYSAARMRAQSGSASHRRSDPTAHAQPGARSTLAAASSSPLLQ